MVHQCLVLQKKIDTLEFRARVCLAIFGRFFWTIHDDVDIENEILDTSIAHRGGGGGVGCCFSPVVVGWVGERGGGGCGIEGALDLDIYIFTYCF